MFTKYIEKEIKFVSEPKTMNNIPTKWDYEMLCTAQIEKGTWSWKYRCNISNISSQQAWELQT